MSYLEPKQAGLPILYSLNMLNFCSTLLSSYVQAVLKKLFKIHTETSATKQIFI